ncbi:UNVERIFIED_CONTAM: hypothetical protein Sradi_3334700 [Sesamum radiatum]|uniref:Uncharacterized protein n=1 Tax=Sesamum radiatum TaxID=300843 RepID=A0AAW2R1V0_SESRA
MRIPLDNKFRCVGSAFLQQRQANSWTFGGTFSSQMNRHFPVYPSTFTTLDPASSFPLSAKLYALRIENAPLAPKCHCNESKVGAGLVEICKMHSASMLVNSAWINPSFQLRSSQSRSETVAEGGKKTGLAISLNVGGRGNHG